MNIDPSGRAVPLVIEFIWDGGNVVYDVVTGQWVDAAADFAAMCTPFVPAGLPKLRKLSDLAENLLGNKKKVHGNTADDALATLYEKYDKNGEFLKHGITKHEDPTKRYTKAQIDGGTVVPVARGPRKEMLKKERDLVERSPGPDNREPWAGRNKGQ